MHKYLRSNYRVQFKIKNHKGTRNYRKLSGKEQNITKNKVECLEIKLGQNRT